MELTPHQKLILEGLAQGGLLIQDKHNCLRLGELMLQQVTREFLVKNRLIERLDKTRGAGVAGNGFVITQKGRATLTEATSVTKGNPK